MELKDYYPVEAQFQVCQAGPRQHTDLRTGGRVRVSMIPQLLQLSLLLSVVFAGRSALDVM